MRPVRRLLLCIIMIAAARPAIGQSEKLIVIENADSLVARVIENEQARELIGNVRFSQERVRVSCDKAVQFTQSGNVQLAGNVVIIDDSVTMQFPRGMYYRNERRAVAHDSVRLYDGRMTLTARYGDYLIEPKRAFFRRDVVAKDNESTLYADSMTYFRSESRTVAHGRVRIESHEDNVTIKGGHFEAFQSESYNRMTQRPILVQFDTSAATGEIDTLVVRSKVMESYGDTVRRLVATDSVEMIRTEMSAVAGKAQFFTSGDSILLRKAPVIWYESTQISGDSINIYLEKRKLRLVHVMGSCMAISRSDSLGLVRYDQLTGEEMFLRFGQDGMESIDVNDRAISVYHLYEDSLANGLNKTSGDRIVLEWDQKKLSSIRIYGGVEGDYFPENMVLGREKDFALPGFAWRDHKPVLRRSDFHQNLSVK